MSTSSCKHRPLADADTLTNIAHKGTLIDNMNFKRTAIHPRATSEARAARARSELTSIVLGDSKNHWSSLHKSTFVPHDVDICQGESRKNILRSMLNKNFILSQESDTVPCISEYASNHKHHPIEAYMNRRNPVSLDSHPATKRSVFLGSEPFQNVSTSMATYSNPNLPSIQTHKTEKLSKDSPNVPFAFGFDNASWETEHTAEFIYPETQQNSGRKCLRVTNCNPLNDVLSLKGNYETTTSAVHKNLGAQDVRHSLSKKDSNFALGYMPRICKTTYRGDFKDTEFKMKDETFGNREMASVRPPAFIRFPRKQSTQAVPEYTVRTCNLEKKFSPFLT